MTEHRYKTTLARAPFSGDGHTILANAALRDHRLSWKARGILGYLGSHSFGWGVSEKQLEKEAPDGLASLRSGLTELEEFSYMRRFRERLANGSLGDALWVISDNPGVLGSYAAELRATFEAEGRRFVEMPVRTRKRSKRAAEPTCENRTLDGSEQNRRSGPTYDFPTLGDPNQANRITKKTKDVEEGEEGDAHARATGDSSAGDEPSWGVAGGTGFAAPTLASANLVRDIAGQVLLPGEALTAADHQRLAMLVEAARPVVDAQPGLAWEEYEKWLRQGWVRPDGRRTFRTLPGALAWRLQPAQIQGEAWAWACEQRGAQEASEAQGERDVPKPRTHVHTGTCGRHKVALSDESKCLRCEHEEAQEIRQHQHQGPEPADLDGTGAEEMGPEELAAASYTSLLGTEEVRGHAAAARELLDQKRAEKEAHKPQEAAAKEALQGIIAAADQEEAARP